MAKSKIITGLKQAVRYSRGEETGAKVYVWTRCGCCDRSFTVPKNEKDSRIFCDKCEPE